MTVQLLPNSLAQKVEPETVKVELPNPFSGGRPLLAESGLAFDSALRQRERIREGGAEEGSALITNFGNGLLGRCGGGMVRKAGRGLQQRF